MSHSEAPVLLVERRGGHSMHSPRLELRKVPMPQSVCMYVGMGKSVCEYHAHVCTCTCHLVPKPISSLLEGSMPYDEATL